MAVIPAFTELVDSPLGWSYDTQVRQGTRIAVFGRADLEPGSSGYVQAQELGRMLAGEGCVVLTGGYGGAMEAVCRGAKEAGGKAEGVVCRAFSGRAPNPFLTRVVWTDDLLARTRTLVEGADAYVALDPRTGTLAEVLSVWALFKAGHLSARPLVLVGDDWKRLHATLLETGIVERNLLEWSVCVSGPRQVLAAIEGTADRESAPHG